MQIVIDLVLLAILIICVWSGYRKGFIIGIANLLGIVVALYAAVLVSSAFSYDVVPVLRPFVSGYVEGRMNEEVLEEMGLEDTDLSYEDILAGDAELRHEFCKTCYETVGIYEDAADQMAAEAESYADASGALISEAIVEVLCERLCYVAGVTLLFLIFLIALMAIANIPNLSYRIPNMDLLNDAGGAAMGLVLLRADKLVSALRRPDNRAGHPVLHAAREVLHLHRPPHRRRGDIKAASRGKSPLPGVCAGQGTSLAVKAVEAFTARYPSRPDALL